MLLHLIISNKAENSLNHDKSSQCDIFINAGFWLQNKTVLDFVLILGVMFYSMR